MLKIVGTHEDGSIADEKVLIGDDGKPTAFLCGLAALEIACDVALAIVLARTVFKRR